MKMSRGCDGKTRPFNYHRFIVSASPHPPRRPLSHHRMLHILGLRRTPESDCDTTKQRRSVASLKGFGRDNTQLRPGSSHEE